MISPSFVFLLSCFFTYSGGAVWAEDSVDPDLNKIKNEIVDIDKKHRQEMVRVYELNKKIRKVVDEKGRMDDQMIVLKSQAQDIAKKIVGLEEKTKDQKKKLHRRLRALYKMSGQSLMKVLFGSRAKGDVDRNLRFLSIIARQDHKEIKNFSKTITQLRNEKKKLNQTVAKLLRVKKNVKTKEKTLITQQKAKAHLIKRLQTQKKKNIAEIKKIRLKSQGPLPALSDYHQKFFFEKKGNLPPPTRAPLLQAFGLTSGVNPGVQLSHKGFRYQKAENQNVYAIDRGKVSFVGLIGGYASTVIIDHGDEYYSVYGQLNKVIVKPGDHVAAETLIANVDSLSGQEQGLYFEIRHFSQPQNPAEWLSNKDFKISAVR